MLGGSVLYDGTYAYGYTPALFNAALEQSVQWLLTAPGSEDLPAGVYSFAQLPTGLQASDFGNSLYGGNNGAGAVFFSDDYGTLTNSQVEIVPEPGTFVLLAAGIAAMYFAYRRRRPLSKKAASQEACSIPIGVACRRGQAPWVRSWPPNLRLAVQRAAGRGGKRPAQPPCCLTILLRRSSP